MRHKKRAIEVLIIVIHFRENKRKFFCKKVYDNQNSKFNPCAESDCIHWKIAPTGKFIYRKHVGIIKG